MGTHSELLRGRNHNVWSQAGIAELTKYLAKSMADLMTGRAEPSVDSHLTIDTPSNDAA